MTESCQPNDTDAEVAVLAEIVMNESEREKALAELQPQHFFDPKHRAIFEAIASLAERSEAVDLPRIAGALRDRDRMAAVGGAAALASLIQDTPSVASVGPSVRRIIDKWRLRELIRVSRTIAANAAQPIEDASAFIDSAEQQVYALAQSRHDQKASIQSFADWTKQTIAKLSAKARGTVSGVPTGFAALDAILAGLHAGDLTIIAARPGMGKSSLAGTIAINVAMSSKDKEQRGVVFFSVEMPGEQVTIRTLCADARIDLGHTRSMMLSEREWSSLQKSASDCFRAPLWIDDKSSLSLLYMRSQLRRLQTDYDIALVVVDYLQLMQGTRGARREEEIASISRGLKEFAKSMNVAVIALAQLNRSVETRSTSDRRPLLSDLRESGSIEQDADNVLFIYREDYYAEEGAAETNIAEIIVAKQRNGPTGTVKLRWTGECARFDNLSEEEMKELERHEQR